MLELRKSEERGSANHGWLRSQHTFSFGDYHDPRFTGFGALVVINEDHVAPGMGFSEHGHRDMEIISYVLSGELAHHDSMGNGSILQVGDVQRMSAGTGVRHSEMNHSRQQEVHFLQMWIRPSSSGIAPSYQQIHFPPEDKRGQLRLIASGDGRDGSVLIHQDAALYAGLFDDGQGAQHPLAPGRRSYVHVVRGSINVNGMALLGGDGAMLKDEARVQLADGQHAEVLVFDLP